MDDVEQALVERLEARIGRRPALGEELLALGIDSVELAGFLVEIEDRFRMRADEEVFDVRTLGELAGYVRERRRRG